MLWIVSESASFCAFTLIGTEFQGILDYLVATDASLESSKDEDSDNDDGQL